MNDYSEEYLDGFDHGARAAIAILENAIDQEKAIDIDLVEIARRLCEKWSNNQREIEQQSWHAIRVD